LPFRRCVFGVVATFSIWLLHVNVNDWKNGALSCFALVID